LVRPSKIDSSAYKFKEIVSKQHLFQTEKVAVSVWKPKIKRNDLNKMAGFKQPIYEILAFNLQSFQSTIPATSFETNNSPIANDALNDYNYKLLDTIAIDGNVVHDLF
jgi:hypothetical protein